MLDTFNGITFLVADERPFLHSGPLGSSALEILSRINASFQYTPLSKAQTMKIFEINMQSIKDVFSKQHHGRPRPATLVVDQDILEFARAFYSQRSPWDRWNCTQIRKGFNTALALAQADADLSTETQTDDESHEPWTVTLKAAHFEVVARSMPKSGLPPPPPPPPPPPNAAGTGPSTGSVPAARGHLPPTRRPISYNESLQKQLPQQPVPVSLPHSRQLPPAEYRTQIPAPQPPPPPPAMHMQPVDMMEGSGYSTMQRKEFFLASPLSLEARPELRFLDWDAFKDARAWKGDIRSAIDVLKGEPVVSFDQQAQDSVWWSRWADRNREDEPRAKSDANATTIHKVTALTYTESSPLPERIRIHSKYITAILEDIHGSKISKTSFVMVRPFRALNYYEDDIRAKYDELAGKFRKEPDGSDTEAKASDPESVKQPSHTNPDMQPDHPSVVDDDGPLSQHENKSISDDSSSISSVSDDGEAIDTSSNAAFQHMGCLVEFIDMIRARRQYLLSGSCSKVTFADVWHLFKPGDEVLDQEKRQAYRILIVHSSGHRTLPPWRDLDPEEPEGGEPIIIIHAVHIMFDGERLGSIRKAFGIVSFEGEQDISTLPVLPLRLVKDTDTELTKHAAGLRQALIDRGRMFVRMAKSTPMHYNGPLLHPKEEVDSQVVIDFQQAFDVWTRANPNFKRPVVEKLIGKPIGQPLIDIPCFASCCAGEQIYRDAYAEQNRNEAYIGTLIPDPQDRTHKPSLAIHPRAIRDKAFEESELSDEDLVIMSYMVSGFVLRSRKWGKRRLSLTTHISGL